MIDKDIWIYGLFGLIALMVTATALVSIHAWTRAILDENGPRFSLRTLLIATTLVAVVLGLGVWLRS